MDGSSKASGRDARSIEEHVQIPCRVISPGLAFGYAHLEDPLPATYPLQVRRGEEDGEVARLDAAVDRVRKRLEEYLREFHFSAETDLKQILHAQLLILDDREFFKGITRRIRDQQRSAEHAVEEEFSAVANRLGASRDYYLRARAEDLRGICQLVLKSLLLEHAAFGPVDQGKERPVYYSAALRPTAVLRARKAGAVAFITSSTAYTSHAAILLRGSGIPALGGLDLASIPLEEGTPLLVDAVHGVLHFHPPEAVLEEAFRRERELEEAVARSAEAPEDGVTADGRRVRLWANIDHPSQALMCLEMRLFGVGLFRTEFMVLDTGRVPAEEEQYGVYRVVVERLAGRPLVLRTFDIGGDKVLDGLHDARAANPALGIRGLRRHLMRRPREFRTQLRAMLRAAEGADVSILLPMVTHAGDVLAARAHLEAVKEELRESGIPFNPAVKLGAMIEVPSAALNVGAILERTDFVSLGTNDLLQYLTASDRDDPEVSVYQNLELSGLEHLLGMVMDQARAMGRADDVRVCGELASDPQGVGFLVRAGIRSLSIAPGAAALVRSTLAGLTVEGDGARNGV